MHICISDMYIDMEAKLISYCGIGCKVQLIYKLEWEFLGRDKCVEFRNFHCVKNVLYEICLILRLMKHR